ncbi:MAG: PBP1A family penicillin-binding protein [Elusimicrobia bacterium]|nr:PBP1A family penicillin-binding protein [Elusimicrobiota bacterium]
MARKGAKPVLAAAAGAAALLSVGAWVALRYADRRLAPLVAGDVAPAYTTRVYGTPKSLRVGDPLSPAELRERLKRLGYAQGIPDRPGLYREESLDPAGRRFEVHLRGFERPFVRPTPHRVRVDLVEGFVSALVLAESGVPLLEAVLEPEALYEVSAQGRVRRRPLKPGEAPRWMMDAVVSVEDRRFREHGGVDLKGILRAAARNLRSGRVAQGGSTLTQQLAKNLFLTPRRTFSRKAKEAALALYLEGRYSKDDILRLYLDTVYFGQDGPVGVFGLAAAAKLFFDKEPANLDLAECAVLAGLLASPGRYDPRRDPEASLTRRRVVLAAMRRQGAITPAQERAAGVAALRLAGGAGARPRAADYFLAWVERQLDERHPDEHLMARGITVHTTLDPWLQEAARTAVKRAKHQAALVALDPKDGAVRALVGGKDYATAPFDRATRALRQPGSAFKPVVYAAALTGQSGKPDAVTAATLLEDSTRSWTVDGGTWTPRNYDKTYRGPVALRAALAQSLNAATVDLASRIGVARVAETARGLGVLSSLRPELGLALGASEVTLLELCGAYCAFDNGGRRVEPHGIDAVLAADGSVLEARHPESFPAMSEPEAYLMTDLLREVVRTGTAKSLLRRGLGGVSAGKTGTTDDGRDAWFIGYSPWLLAGVWTGEDQPRPLPITGASAALPVWADFMTAALPSALLRPELADPWPRPDIMEEAEVDPASGLRAHAGCPTRRSEVFVPGTAPAADCPLHKKGVVGWIKDLFKRR